MAFYCKVFWTEPAIATDLNGNIVWYRPSDISLSDAATDRRNVSRNLRKRHRGSFAAIFSRIRSGRHHHRGNQRGASKPCSSRSWACMPSMRFHHEARKLPNGNYLVLADSRTNSDECARAGSRGCDRRYDPGARPESAGGLVWDSFDHLDNSRQAILGETCAAGNAGCAPWYLAPVANDWLHGNALQLTPDGNILYSMRNQDWVIKIDYENGSGSGNILWHLGNAGDFSNRFLRPLALGSRTSTTRTSRPTMSSFLVFDDGNTRVQNDPAASPTAAGRCCRSISRTWWPRCC